MEKVPKCFECVFLAKNHTLYFQFSSMVYKLPLAITVVPFNLVVTCFGVIFITFHNLRLIPFCAKDPLKIRIMGD